MTHNMAAPNSAAGAENGKGIPYRTDRQGLIPGPTVVLGALVRQKQLQRINASVVKLRQNPIRVGGLRQIRVEVASERNGIGIGLLTHPTPLRSIWPLENLQQALERFIGFRLSMEEDHVLFHAAPLGSELPTAK